MEPTTDHIRAAAVTVKETGAAYPEPPTGIVSAQDRLEGLATRADLAMDRLVSALGPVIRPLDVPPTGRLMEERQVSPVARHLHDQADRLEVTLDRLDNAIASLDV